MDTLITISVNVSCVQVTAQRARTDRACVHHARLDSYWMCLASVPAHAILPHKHSSTIVVLNSLNAQPVNMLQTLMCAQLVPSIAHSAPKFTASAKLAKTIS